MSECPYCGYHQDHCQCAVDKEIDYRQRHEDAIRAKCLTDNGEPRHVTCYDKPDTLDRYTVVFEYMAIIDPSHAADTVYYIGMSEHPTHPQGFGQHGEAPIKDFNPGGTIIPFAQLPPDCQSYVKSEYIQLWELEKVKIKAILEIDLPESCCKCQFFDFSITHSGAKSCFALNDKGFPFLETETTRAPFCPLRVVITSKADSTTSCQQEIV